MSGVLHNLKSNESLYNVVSGIDRNLFREYNVPYCTHQSNEVFFVVIADEAHIPTDIRKAWSGAQSHCLDNGVDLSFIIMNDYEYNNWVKMEVPYIKDVGTTTTPKLLESGYFSINGK